MLEILKGFATSYRVRLCFLIFLIFVISGGLTTSQGNENTSSTQNSKEEQKKQDLFLKAREDIKPIRAIPSPTPKTVRTVPRAQNAQTESPTPKPARNSVSAPPDSSVFIHTPTADTTLKPSVSPRSSPIVKVATPATPQVMPKTPQVLKAILPSDSAPPTSPGIIPTAKSPPTPKPTPFPKQTSTPKPSPTPKHTPVPKEEKPAPVEVLIEKSGNQADRGLQPLPFHVSAPGWRWRYVTSSIRQAIDRAPVRRARWKYIVIHNSATRQGNAKIFDNYHRRVRKMPNGMAYHFVIGNGSSSGNGEIEIGERWVKQINGGHVASDYLNNMALGICLVGDYDRDLPTKEQLSALHELLTYLRARNGKNDGRYAKVFGHREINPKPTSCPGKRFPTSTVRKAFP